MKNILKIALFLLFIFNITPLFAEDLFYTYAGGHFAYGINNIEYSDWNSDKDKRETQSVIGSNFLIGLNTTIFVNYFAGEFLMSASINMNDNEDTSIHHMDWNANFKFVYNFNDLFALSTGPGIYIESAPSTEEYDGGGLRYSLGTYFTFSGNWKLMADIFGKYGYYGLGEDSVKLNYGLIISISRKVGTL